MKILLTGGSGLLGTELRKHNKKILAPTSEELDITDYNDIDDYLATHKVDVLIHAAAATHPPEHEEHPEIGIKTNIIGTANVAMACNTYGVKLVYISTDYVYTGKGPHKADEAVLPPSKYAWSKRLR